MRIDIVTLFPEMFGPVLEESIVGKARKKGYLQICCHQLRDFSSDPRRRVDDTVFGGARACCWRRSLLPGVLTNFQNIWEKGRI